ncbi:MerR family DNA-binding transcriptional regulator [Streptomyces sp. NBC_00996]|uniref:MerR family DNA-binding transcriptional regulator n=1 Tax=Streptomyces sp. NBC_00996 TaxID=2903710 RepID=UPI00386B44D0|nr:MerR family DNA-binding transcriptional regulator [Streptomyces sp. NBC_00996]
MNIQTLRYYERRGLLAEPDRSPGGHRLYDEEAVTVLRVIKGAAPGIHPRRGRRTAGGRTPPARPPRRGTAGARRGQARRS